MPSEHICYHKRLRPTKWNQPKPEPCVMVPCVDYREHTHYYCPICDWGWSMPNAPEQAVARAVKKAAQIVFMEEAADASTE